jgi:hypothetical protein
VMVSSIAGMHLGCYTHMFGCPNSKRLVSGSLNFLRRIHCFEERLSCIRKNNAPSLGYPLNGKKQSVSSAFLTIDRYGHKFDFHGAEEARHHKKYPLNYCFI